LAISVRLGLDTGIYSKLLPVRQWQTITIEAEPKFEPLHIKFNLCRQTKSTIRSQFIQLPITPNRSRCR